MAARRLRESPKHQRRGVLSGGVNRVRPTGARVLSDPRGNADRARICRRLSTLKTPGPPKAYGGHRSHISRYGNSSVFTAYPRKTYHNAPNTCFSREIRHGGSADSRRRHASPQRTPRRRGGAESRQGARSCGAERPRAHAPKRSPEKNA